MFKSRLFSTGGDEVNIRCYTDDPETQQALLTSGRTLEQALDVFTQSTHGVLRAAGKTPVVWEGERSLFRVFSHDQRLICFLKRWFFRIM
jgi:hypothetical protein